MASSNMLRPFLLVGVGGSGGKTLRAVRDALEMKLNLLGWTEGIPTAWQFLHYDTPVVQDGSDFPASFLPQNAYVGLSTAYGGYANLVAAISSRTPASQRERLLRQLPDPNTVPVNIDKGAGQYRAVGRAAILARLDKVAAEARAAVANMNGAATSTQLARVTELLQGKKLDVDVKAKAPLLIIISSVAGGSGAGQYMDVAEALKAELKDSWARNSVGILYAPDIFDGIAGNAGIASNSLAVTSETTNGLWNSDVESSVVEVYKGYGLTIANISEGEDRVGVRYPFIVGRQNENTSFESGEDVYRAISQTLAAWISEDTFQNTFDSYVIGNWEQSNARNVVQEHSGFNNSDMHLPTFGGLGFARVTLGREKFALYAQERLARSVIDRLLQAHIIKRGDGGASFIDNTEDQIIAEDAQSALVSFLTATGWNEEGIGENQNQIKDAMYDKVATPVLTARFTQQVTQEVTAGVNPNKALDQNTWQQKILIATNNFIDGYLEEDRANRAAKFEEWLATKPQQLLSTVTRFAVTHGLPVTQQLMDELVKSLKIAAEELESERVPFIRAIDALGSYITSGLLEGGQAPVRIGSDPFNKAVAFAGQYLDWQIQSQNLHECAELIKDALKNFVVPLNSYVKQALTHLRNTTEATTTPDGRPNGFKDWATYKSEVVAAKFRTSSNERMLVKADEFPSEFLRLMKGTFTNTAQPLDAVIEALPEVIVGDPKNPLNFIDVEEAWSPTVFVGRASSRSGKAARFIIPRTPEEYLVRANIWLNRKGTAFATYLGQSIRDWLDPSQTPEGQLEVSRRGELFLGELATAMDASGPLVKLNNTLIQAIHGKPRTPSNDHLVCSGLPFQEGEEIYQQCYAIVEKKVGSLGNPKAFFSVSQATSVEFFQATEHSFNPIVIDSLMEPIARGWNAVSASSQSRAGFWKWKRARLLHESVPMDHDTLTQMTRGWFIAQAFAQLALSDDAAMGPRILVKDASGADLSFPHPLLYRSAVVPADDYLGAVLESSLIVQALANSQASLEPLKPYKRLYELGSEMTTSQLGQWITSGIDPFAFTNPASLAQRPESTTDASARAALICEWTEKLKETFESTIMADKGSLYNRPNVWEIAPIIIRVLDGIISDFKDFKGGSSAFADGIVVQ